MITFLLSLLGIILIFILGAACGAILMAYIIDVGLKEKVKKCSQEEKQLINKIFDKK